MKIIKLFKNITLILAIVFLLTASVFIVLTAVFFDNESAEHGTSELFYWLAISSATICLCLLPIMSFLKSAENKQDQMISDELKATHEALNSFADLVNSKEYIFSSNVLSSFYSSLGVTDNVSTFHQFSSNRVYYDSINTAINASIASKVNNKKALMWADYLASSINDCWHVYALEKNLKDDEELFKKIDVFCRSLIYVCNKLEVIAYSFMELRISKKTFIEELYSPIDTIYTRAYYFLVKLNNHTSFPALDSSCRMIYEEKKQRDI